MKPYHVFKENGFWWFAERNSNGELQLIIFALTLENLWEQAAIATQLVSLRAI